MPEPLSFVEGVEEPGVKRMNRAGLVDRSSLAFFELA